MFERYSEKARRVIFFARYEASQLGSPYIQPEHLLLGLLREDKLLWLRIAKLRMDWDAIRAEIAKNSPSTVKVETSVDLPLSQPAKRVLFYGAEEAEQLGHSQVLCVHLLLGLMREPSLAVDILSRDGVSLEAVRLIAQQAEAPPIPQSIRNALTLDQLRKEFARSLALLTPEIEPAVTYRP